MEQGPANQNDVISYEILKAIRRIIRRISDHSRSLSRDVGLTVPQLLCLKTIGESTEDEVTLVNVSGRVRLSPATVSGIVDRLERDGLVLRERRSKDRRKVCLSLTAEGRTRFESMPTPLQESFVHRLMSLDESERRGLLQSLEQVVDLMEAQDLDVSPILTPGDVRADV